MGSFSASPLLQEKAQVGRAEVKYAMLFTRGGCRLVTGELGLVRPAGSDTK